MFDVMTVAALIAVMVVAAALGVAAGFQLGKSRGQELARTAKSEELEAAKEAGDAAQRQIAQLNAQSAELRAQVEG